MDKTVKIACGSLVLNIAFSAYHIILGVTTYSWWLFTIGIYHGILSVVRFVVLRSKREGRFTLRFTGIMLMLLSIPIVGTVILSFVRDRGSVFHLIPMLTIAVYAFTKITLATVNLIRSRHSMSAKHTALRSISFADAFVSIFSLQRSMLVSFEGMSEVEIRIMNTSFGSAVCIIVFLLGLHLMNKKR